MKRAHSSAVRMRMTLLWLLGLVLGACAGRSSFGSTFPVNQTAELEAALARAKQAGRAPGRQVVVGVTESPRGVFAYDVSESRLLFSQPGEVSGVPVPAGPFAVVPMGKLIRVLRLDSGSKVAEFPSDGMHLVGADSDGTLTAIVLSTGGSMGARSTLVLMEGERIRASRSLPKHLGGPAVLGGLVFLPHNRVHLSVVDARGEELVRLQVREDVASQAFAFDNQVYFGLAGIYRVDAKTGLGASGGAHYYKPQLSEKLPGQPAFLPNTADPPPAVNSAVHRVSLSFLPELEGEQLGLLDDALYLAFYRQIYAIDPATTRAHFVYQTQSDAVGVRAVPGGVVVVEESGKVVALDRTGAAHWSGDLGLRPVVARIQVDQLPGAGSGAEPAPPLTIQLVDAALNPDTRLVPARALAVSMLANQEEEDATAALIELCQERSTPERVRKVACVALAKRTNGSDAIVAALDRHANYLEQTKAPPVGPLAEAAMRTGDVRVVPQLLAHLADPETPADELPALMLALKQLATLEHAPAIGEFMRLYHADADEPRLTDAVIIAIGALAKLQGAAAQSQLEAVASDGLAPPSVRAAASQALAGLVEQTPAQTSAAPELTPTAEPDGEDEPEDAGPPEHRTALHLERALRPVAVQLSKCVRDAPKRPNSARLSVVLDGAGNVIALETLPAELKSCIEPLVRSVSYPANKYGRRETLTHTITR